MRYRSVDTITGEHLGHRVTLRRRLDDGSLSDVIGIVEHLDAASIIVRDRNGDRVAVGRADIVAARVIDAPPLENPQDPAPG